MPQIELIRSSTFRLALVYTALFAGSVLLLLGFIYWSTVAFMSEQVDATIETEIVGLAEQYRARGLNGLVRTINDRVDRNPDSSSIYLFASPGFRPLAGNLTGWPDGAPSEAGWLNFIVDDPSENLKNVSARARVFALQGNFKLLVGRDVRDLAVTQQLIERALLWGVLLTVVMALIGGVVISRTMLRRLDEINQTSREIMSGDLSRRIPTRGNDDEFDQLAGNLNDMLDEIERLMDGIRHVSDNIAHDLRTPLTRLRQRLEESRNQHQTSEAREAQIEDSIAEADQLLATFSALLRIARIEAGGYRPALDEIDTSSLITDAADLYEALADHNGLKLSVETGNGAKILGDRDLIFQAIANLLDNALKYTPSGGDVRLSSARADGRVVLCVADSGPGIPTPERDNVMRRFYRLEPSRGMPGSGLGLSLVSAVAAIHNAEFLLEDNHPGLRAGLSFEAADTQQADTRDSS